VRLPRSLSSKELEIRDIVRSKIKRGKVILNIFIDRQVSPDTLNFNMEAVGVVADLLKEMKAKAQIDKDITLQDILSFSDFLKQDKTEENPLEYELTRQALDVALQDLIRMRLKEGEELKKDLLKRVATVEEYLNKIEKLRQESVVDYFAKLKERTEKLFSDYKFDEDRLATELALLTEKADITEECVRLKSHIKMFLDVLQNGKEAGRKLNFILQEMNRETNTINSKTVSTEISQIGIGIKEELEKLREQIQNVE
jgi:uncharacterized protein (TIGR00255 family)